MKVKMRMRVPPAAHAGAQAQTYAGTFSLGCRGELRWTELPYTLSVPLH